MEPGHQQQWYWRFTKNNLGPTQWGLIVSPHCAGEDGPGTASSYMMQSQFDMDIYGEAPDKMTYTEQANKRSHCKRLTWWVQANSLL